MNFLPKVLLNYIFNYLSSSTKLVVRKVCTKFWRILFIGNFWVNISVRNKAPIGHYKHLVYNGDLRKFEGSTIDKLYMKKMSNDNIEIIKRLEVKHLVLTKNTVSYVNLGDYKLNKLNVPSLYPINHDYLKNVCSVKFNSGINMCKYDNVVIEFDEIFELPFVNDEESIWYYDRQFNVIKFPEGVKRLKIKIINMQPRYLFIIYPASLEYLTLNIKNIFDEGKVDYKPWIREFPKSLRRLKIYSKIPFSNYFEVKYK